MATFLARVFAYLESFSVAWENFGIFSAARLFLLCRRQTGPDGASLWVKKLRRRIVFRGQMDKGVLSHLYKPGYRIRDTAAQPIRVILDVGANIGDETLRFRHFHPEATIVAIEPDSGNFAMLSRNCAPDPRTVLLQNGLWSHQCRLRVLPGESAEGFRVEEVDGETPADVEAVSIPSLMDRFSFGGIDILKMDIEGAEYQVFSAPDIGSWIGRVKVLILECPDSDRPGATQRLFEAIRGLDFVCQIHGECFVLIRRETGWTLESNLYL